MQVSNKAVKFLRDLGVEVVVDPQHHQSEIYQLAGVEFSSYAECAVVLAIGGDGTLLSAAHWTGEWRMPLGGINLGSLGFMTEIDVEVMQDALTAIVAGNYSLDQRMLLKVWCKDKLGQIKYEDFAVNDAVCNRDPSSPIQTYQVNIDNETVELIPGDGIIISSPTGSTGYAMAAGGPIIDPRVRAILFTPLCPHTLHNRNYVLAEDSVIEIRLQQPNSSSYLSVDGRNTIQLDTDDVIKVAKNSLSLNLISLTKQNFYTKVPEKIQKRSLGRAICKNWLGDHA